VRIGGFLALALFLSACGYSLVGRGKPSDPSIRTIGVPLFKDQTQKAGLDQLITSKVIEELLKRGHYKVVQEDKGVDALVLGELTAYTVAPVGFADPTKGLTQANRYSITLSARVKYIKAGQADPIWSNDAFSFKDEYDIGNLNQYYFDREGQAIDRLGTDFARTLITTMFEVF
jgi:hypothetical protein